MKKTTKRQYAYTYKYDKSLYVITLEFTKNDKNGNGKGILSIYRNNNSYDKTINDLFNLQSYNVFTSTILQELNDIDKIKALIDIANKDYYGY